MFRSTLLVTALVLALAAAVLCSVVGILRAKTAAGKADAGGSALLAAAVAAVGLGWAPSGQLPLAAVLGAVFLWFVGRMVFQLATPSPGSGDGAAPAVYHAVLAGLGGWVLFEAARNAGSGTGHPGHELGVLLVDLLVAIVMVFASAGWLLATFTLRADSGPRPVPGLTAAREALVAAGLALALFAVS